MNGNEEPMRTPSVARSLLGLRRLGENGAPTVGEALDHLSDRSSTLILLLLGLLSMVPSPGLPAGLLFGSAIALIGGRMLRRDGTTRLPDFVSRRRLPPTVLRAALKVGVPPLRRVERWSRPRLAWMAGGVGLALTVVMVVIQGLLLIVPVPFGNAVPGAAVAVLAMGLLTGDGLTIAAGHLVGLGAVLFTAVLTSGFLWAVAAAT